jgi:hypothetical protein
MQLAVGFEMKPGLTCVAYDSTKNVVMAVQQGSFQPYVTWKYDWDADHREYVTWASHYFTDIVDAAKDFRGRI